MKRSLILHPLVFMIYPLIFLFVHNIGQTVIEDFYGPTVAVLVVGSLIWFLVFLIVRDWMKASVWMSLALILFFSYGHIYSFLETLSFCGAIARHRNLMPFWIGLLGGVTYYVLRAPRFLDRTSHFLCRFAIVLSVVAIVQIAAFEWGADPGKGKRVEFAKAFGNTLARIETKDLPNIYYIILDGYANEVVLKELFNFDNSDFTNFLEEKGFYVAHDSRANYGHTFLSVSSALNFEYWTGIEERLGRDSKDMRIPIRKLDFNEFARYVKRKGYKFVHFTRGFGIGNRNQFSDIEIQCGNIPRILGNNELFMLLVQSSALLPLEQLLIREDLRQRILCAMEQLADLHNRVKRPFFVFAHILCPHHPYLFDAEGHPRKEVELRLDNRAWTDPKLYLNQLTFLNRKVKEMIIGILEQEEELSPIIILQSDHGTKFTKDPIVDGNMYYKERLGILNAYYVPATVRNDLYQSITPINTFRLIVEKGLAGSKMPLLEDRSFYSPDDRFYDFKDVTELIRAERSLLKPSRTAS